MRYINIFPEKEGWFWLYGRVWGDEDPQFYPVQVIKVSSGFIHNLSNHMLTEKDIEGGYFFSLAVLPKTDF